MADRDGGEQIAARLGIGSLPAQWAPFVAEAADVRPWFVQDDYLTDVSAELGVMDEDLAALRQAASSVRSNPASSALAWLWHRALFPDGVQPPTRRDEKERERIGEWPMPPDPDDAAGLMDGMFPLLVLLSGYRHAQALYERLELPRQVVADALSGVPSCLAAYRERTGRRGLGLMYLSWLLLAFRGRLYRRGVLNYEIGWLGHDVHVFRHRATGEVVVLAGDGLAFDADGVMVGRAAPAPRGGLTAVYRPTPEVVTGHPFDEAGRVSRVVRALDRDDWEQVLKRADPVLSVHIPRQGKLTAESCQESLSDAAQFFGRYFADHRFGGFTCTSWMLDPRLADLLPPGSNIVRFQRLFRLFSTPPGPDAIYWFVFRGQVRPVGQLPEDTTLQRRLKQYLADGGQLGGGGGVIITAGGDLGAGAGGPDGGVIR